MQASILVNAGREVSTFRFKQLCVIVQSSRKRPDKPIGLSLLPEAQGCFLIVTLGGNTEQQGLGGRRFLFSSE
jgi:hypothetical protein